METEHATGVEVELGEVECLLVKGWMWFCHLTFTSVASEVLVTLPLTWLPGERT